jgi:hypothetical protein
MIGDWAVEGPKTFRCKAGMIVKESRLGITEDNVL